MPPFPLFFNPLVGRAVMAAALVASGFPSDTFAAEPVLLSRQGEALLPIVVNGEASEALQPIANELAEVLGKMGGTRFSVSTSPKGDGAVVLGLLEDHPEFQSAFPSDRPDYLLREDYLLRSVGGSLYIISRTPLGVRNGVWDLLHRLGYRHYFPGEIWEIIPERPELTVAADTLDRPAFFERFWIYGGGLERHLSEPTSGALNQWRERNRLVSGFTVKAGHMYQDVIRLNQEVFDDHPNYLSTGGKLDPTHPEVLDLVTELARKQLKARPGLDGVSVAPSDGRGWREDSPLGSASNQAITIANHVVERLNQEFPDKKVALLAYSAVTEPPTIPVHPNVIVKVSDYGRDGGFPIKDLLLQWKAAGADVGVSHPTLDSFVFSHDLPGARMNLSANPWATAEKIREDAQNGAHYWTGSSTGGWASLGLGRYLTAQMLWKPLGEAEVQAEIDDFYQTAFENVAPEMKEFHEKYLLSTGRPMISEDLIGRMYRQLAEIREKAERLVVKERIGMFVGYVRYLELYLAYFQSRQKERQKAYAELVQFAARCDASGNYLVIHPHPVQSIARRDPKLKPVTVEAAPSPISEGEIEALLETGIARNHLAEFEPVSFSSNLVPYAGNDHQEVVIPMNPYRTVQTNRLYLYAENEGAEFTFTITGAMTWENMGPVTLRLYAKGNVVLDDPVAEATIPADKHPHEVKLKSPYAGLHWLEYGDGASGGTGITWPEGQRAALPAAMDEATSFSEVSFDPLYFYVPEGTEQIGGFTKNLRGRILSPDGKVAHDFREMSKAGYFSISVPPDWSGRWWRMVNPHGKILLTVPPFLSRSPAEGLIPDEVR